MREMAADVNIDGRITPIDLVEIRKIILGKEDHFADTDSWRFFTPDMQTSVQVHSNQAPLKLDWTGVKMGDVTLDADASRGRNKRSLTFVTTDQELINGQQYVVQVKTQPFQNLAAYQYSILFDQEAIEVYDIQSDNLGLDSSNFHFADPGVITTVWYNDDWNNFAKGRTLSGSETIFTLVLNAKTNAQLSDVLSFGSDITTAVAYGDADQDYAISLEFNNEFQVSELILYQNEPNPFTESTIVRFTLPEATSATIRIYDVSGNLVKQYERDYTKGLNSIKVLVSELNKTGILYYQIETKRYSATKRMAIIN